MARSIRCLESLAIPAGALYFLLVFATGFALGTIRVLWLEPRLGVMVAELLEMPFMLVAIILAARWVVARFAVPLNRRIPMGLVALGLLIVAEATLVLGLRGLTLADYLATRDPVSGSVYLAMLVVFTLMPAWVSRRRPAGQAEHPT